MPGRIRNTKSLAQRIQLDYFKKRYAIPRWRWILSIGLLVIGLSWLGWQMFGSQQAYNAGPLAPAHHVVSRNCAACHISEVVFFRAVKDKACLSCHDGPEHHEQQVFTPSCAGCHMDHRGEVKLAQTSDASCTQCHDGLRMRTGQSKFAAKVTRFDDDHPEFAAKRDGYKDPGVIKFNHKAHLEKRIRLREDDLSGAAVSKATVQLECADCHRPASINQPWPYAQAGIIPAARVSLDPPPRGRLENKAYMAPVAYEKQCQACHALQFDQVVTDLAPHHKTPQEVHEFVVMKFTDYAAAHPHALPPLTQREVRLPARPLPPPSSASEWIKQRVDNAEDWLWRKQKKGCAECHTLKFSAGSTIPEIVKPGIPVRWFSHAVFEHQAHQMVTCISCHTTAKTSELTADVLLPGIKTCQECHSAGSAQPAKTGCFECHAYHDWSKEKPVNGRYALHGSGSAARLAAATER